jgi:hypothetical protein
MKRVKKNCIMKVWGGGGEKYLHNESFDRNNAGLTDSMDVHDGLFFNSRIPPRVLKQTRFYLVRGGSQNMYNKTKIIVLLCVIKMVSLCDCPIVLFRQTRQCKS